MEVSGEQIDFWLNDTTWTFGTLNAPVTDSLVLGGRLNLLSNRELQVMLVKWAVEIAYIESTILRNQNFLDQHFLPFLRSNASIGQIYAADDGQPGRPEVVFPYGEEIEGYTPLSHRDLIQLPQFQNLLIERITLLNEIVGYGDSMERAEGIAKIRLLLERE